MSYEDYEKQMEEKREFWRWMRNNQEKILKEQERSFSSQYSSSSREDACFPGCAPILTPSGNREIGDIQAGDKVLSYGIASQQIVEREVIRKKTHSQRPIWEIRIHDHPPVYCTGNHSFMTDRGWKKARALQPGAQISLWNGKKQMAEFSQIANVGKTDMCEPVYNLITATNHNFIAYGCVAHNFTYLRTVRVWLHRMILDPLYHKGMLNAPNPEGVVMSSGG